MDVQSDLETMEVVDLARELKDNIAVINILERLAFPAVRVRRRSDGTIEYGLGPQVYIEGARVVADPNHKTRVVPQSPESRRKQIEVLERDLVGRWRQTFGFHQVRATELIPFADGLINEMSSERGKANALGQRLSRMCGRSFGGYTVVESGRQKNTARYQLVPDDVARQQ